MSDKELLDFMVENASILLQQKWKDFPEMLKKLREEKREE